MLKRLIPILFCLLIAACGKIPGLPAAVVDSGPTPTPLITSTAPEFSTVPDRTCQVGSLEPLRSAKLPQGDLLAWAPDSLKLAYIAPELNSNWYLGLLKLASGPDFKSPINLSPDTPAYGSLSWSPDGSLLAFISLRLTDNVYTAMTVPVPASAAPTTAASSSTAVANTTTLATDWLPGQPAHTDTSSSLKTVQGWPANDRLRIVTSCGIDCDQALDIDLTTGTVTPYGKTARHNQARFALSLHQLTYDEKTYPVMTQPNWSPDNKKVVFFDDDDRVWILIVDEKVQYIVDAGQGFPRETKWAYDNRHLAVRTDNLIYIFDTECK
jgi:hypothetical protein